MENKYIGTLLDVTRRTKHIGWDDEAFKALHMELEDVKYTTGVIPGAASVHSLNPVGCKASTTLLKALMLYHQKDKGISIGTLPGSEIYVAEYRKMINLNGSLIQTTSCIKWDTATGVLSGCTNKDVAGQNDCEKYVVGNGYEDGVAVLFCMMTELMLDEEFRAKYDLMGDALDDLSKVTSFSGFASNLAVLTSNIIARTDSEFCGERKIALRDNPIAMWSESAMKGTVVARKDDEFSSFKLIGSESQGASGAFIDGLALNDAYKFGEAVYSCEPARLQKSYLPPKEIIEFLEDMKMTNENEKKMRTLLLRGDVGSGKSVGSVAIAAATGKPYVTLVGGPDTSSETTFGSFAPRTKKETIKDIPTYEEMVYEPEESYKRLTGKELKNGENTDLGELFTLSLQKAQDCVSEDTQFDFVYSDIILGLMNGWCVEVQEIDKITNPGVLTQLNNLIEFGYVKLPNGEVVYRHKDSILIFTMNLDCVASRPIDQSIISRCDEVIDLQTPSEDELVKRAMVRTGCQDKDLARALTHRMLKISEFCKEQGITDGSCGFRELISWLSVCMAGRSPEETIGRFIVQKATSSKEDQASIYTMLEGMPTD